ncbi:MAG: M20 family metallo-hydrolase [Anaerolineae bacterium]|nr:M20 family metallo-hydrolase [Anaerolineae bacterium]
MDKKVQINRKRLIQRLDELAQIGALDGGGVSRLTFSDADKAGRDLTVSWMKALELTVHIDQVGNLIAVRPGEEDLPPVMLGSHVDTVTVAGRFDGSYGVLCALEVVQVLNENNIATRRPIAVVAFTNEEGVRYTPGMLGSMAYVGELSVSDARAIQGFDGSNFGEEMDRIGYAGSMEPGAIKPHAFVEIHIEQGPVLDQADLPVGVVHTITGITWLEVTITGTANHAGTTPINLRKDAGLAAAKLIEFLRDIATSIGGQQRATCGMIAFEPNAINVIPSKAVLTVDLRNSDGQALIAAEQRLQARAKELETSDGVTITIRDLEHVLPMKFDPLIVDAIGQSTKELNLPAHRMVSGAGHDAQLLAKMCPTAMIFVRSRDGISHNPAELSSPEDLEKGANVLLQTALNLANQD